MSIRLRFAVLTALVIAVTVGITFALVAARAGRHMAEMVSTDAKTHAEHIAKLACPHLGIPDRAMLQRVVAGEMVGGQFAATCITDRRGVGVAGSRAAYLGKQHPVARLALAAGRPQVGPLGNTTQGAAPVRDSSGAVLGAAIVSVRSAQVRQAMRDMTRVASAIWVFCTILGVVLAYVVGTYVVTPLNAVLRTIRQVASGDFASRIDPPRVPEIRSIGEAFNGMAEAVTVRLRNLEMLNRLATRVLTARRLAGVARVIESSCGEVVDGETRVWVLGSFGGTLRWLSPGRARRHVTADPQSAVSRAAREGRVVVIGSENAEVPSGSSLSPGLPPVEAAVVVPLRTAEGVLGALSVEVAAGRPALTREQIALVVAMGNVVGPAVGSLLRTESQARSARMLQRILVPQPAFEIPGVEVAARYEPAEEKGRLGGDFYDFIRLSGEKWCFVIGDVSGKGLPAAQYAAMSKYVLRSYVFEYESPGPAVSHTNAALAAQMTPEWFVTLFCAVLDLSTLKLRYVRAGHTPPILYRGPNAAVVQLSADGTPAGAFEDATYPEGEADLAPGDVIAMYTDGLTEASGVREMYGEERLVAALEAHAALPARNLADAITEDVRRFAGGRLRDDAAIVVIKVA